MTKLKDDKPRGILNPKTGEKKFHNTRYLPSEEISFFVEHYWLVEWDLRNQEPYVSETLPHPCVHVVFEKDNSKIVGVMRGKFSRLLENKGMALGIKFKPGAFYPFVKVPVSTLTDRLINPEEVFGNQSKLLEEEIFSSPNKEAIIEQTEQFMKRHLPEKDNNIITINNIVERVISDREIIKVEDIVGRFNINKRTLQRLFNQYVGVSPKWVIKRYRLHEAAERLANSVDIDLSKLAIELGYYDQAHFIKDFKSIVGKSPERYLQSDAGNV